MICNECETVAHCTKHGCIPKHQALDKMAENARELGLDYEQYENAIEVSVIFHEGQRMFAVPKQPAQIAGFDVVLDSSMPPNTMKFVQPAQQDIPDLIAGALGVSRGTAYDLMREALAEQPAQQQEPVAYAGVKAWVGNKQVIQCVTQTELHYATQPWLLMLMNAEKCIAALKENT